MNEKPEHENPEQMNVSDDIIAVCAINAALRTDGVAEMAAGFSDMIYRNLLGRDVVAKGIKVSQSEGKAEIDVYIIIRYGYKIPVVAWDIQENVKKEVLSMTGIKVETVNINVQGVKSDDKE